MLGAWVFIIMRPLSGLNWYCDVNVFEKFRPQLSSPFNSICHPNFFWCGRKVHIRRIKHLLDKKTLLLLINSFVFSKLFYCSSVWGNTSKRNLNKLQLVQNFAARVVLGLRKFDHISQGRRSLGWLDVTEKILFNDLVLAFKCVNGLALDYLI